MKSISRTTQVISISLPVQTVEKLEMSRKAEGASRSAFISHLIEQQAQNNLWEKIYRKGQETAKAFSITSEEDIEQILDAA